MNSYSNVRKYQVARQSCRQRRLYSGITTLFFFILITLAASTLANANQVSPDEWLPQASNTIKKQETALKQATPEKTDVETLSNSLKTINQIKSNAQECIASTTTQLQKATEDLTTLGEPTTKESREVINKRHSLIAQQKNLDKQLSSCKLLLLQSQDLVTSINELQQHILAQQLSARTPHIIAVLSENMQTPGAGWQDSVEFLRTQYKLKLLSTQQLSLLTLLLIAGIILSVIFQRFLTISTPLIKQPKDSVSAFMLAARTSLNQALVILAPVGIIAAFLSITLPLSPLPFITKASYMLGIYISLIVLINILLCPTPPAPIYLIRTDVLSRRFAKQLKILATLGLIGFFLFTGEFRAGLSEPVYYLNRSIYSVALTINLIAILWLARLFSWAILSRGPRIFLGLVLITSLLAELTGYRNLSYFVLGGVLATLISLGLTLLIYQLIKDLCDGLDEGRLEWEKNIRQRIGLDKNAMVPGLIW